MSRSAKLSTKNGEDVSTNLELMYRCLLAKLRRIWKRSLKKVSKIVYYIYLYLYFIIIIIFIRILKVHPNIEASITME